jgi:hypothetical protein
VCAVGLSAKNRIEIDSLLVMSSSALNLEKYRPLCDNDDEEINLWDSDSGAVVGNGVVIRNNKTAFVGYLKQVGSVLLFMWSCVFLVLKVAWGIATTILCIVLLFILFYLIFGIISLASAIVISFNEDWLLNTQYCLYILSAIFGVVSCLSLYKLVMGYRALYKIGEHNSDAAYCFVSLVKVVVWLSAILAVTSGLLISSLNEQALPFLFNIFGSEWFLKTPVLVLTVSVSANYMISTILDIFNESFDMVEKEEKVLIYAGVGK